MWVCFPVAFLYTVVIKVGLKPDVFPLVAVGCGMVYMAVREYLASCVVPVPGGEVSAISLGSQWWQRGLKPVSVPSHRYKAPHNATRGSITTALGRPTCCA